MITVTLIFSIFAIFSWSILGFWHLYTLLNIALAVLLFFRFRKRGQAFGQTSEVRGSGAALPVKLLGSWQLLFSLGVLVTILLLNWLTFRGELAYFFSGDPALRLSLSAESSAALKGIVQSSGDKGKEEQLQLFGILSNEPQRERLVRRFAQQVKPLLSEQITFELINPRLQPDRVVALNLQPEELLILRVGNRGEVRLKEISEARIKEAAKALSRTAAPKILYLVGYGERDPTGTKGAGFQRLIVSLINRGFQVQSVSVAGGQPLPEGDLIIVARPTREIPPEDRAQLERFIMEGGGALLLFEPDTPESFLELGRKFGLASRREVVVGKSATVAGETVLTVEPIGISAIGQRATNGLTEANPVQLRVATSFGQSQSGCRWQPLLLSDKASWSEQSLQQLFRAENPEAALDQGEAAGPLPMAVALEPTLSRKQLKQTEEATQAQGGCAIAGAVVAVGDSDWLSNELIGRYFNHELAMRLVEWLAEVAGNSEEETAQTGTEEAKNQVATPPTAFPGYNLAFSEAGRIRGALLFVLLGAQLLTLIGVFVWWRRAANRSTYGPS